MNKAEWAELLLLYGDDWLKAGVSLNWWHTIDGPRKLYLDVRRYGRIAPLYRREDGWDGTVACLNGVPPGKYRIRDIIKIDDCSYDVVIKIPKLGDDIRTIRMNTKEKTTTYQIRLGCWAYHLAGAYEQLLWYRSLGLTD